MPSFRRVVSVGVVGAVVMLAGCRADGPSGPRGMSADSSAVSATRWRYPAKQGNTQSSGSASANAAASVAQCTRRDPQFGAAMIGASGGTLIVGNNTLIVPPGALDTPTLIMGFVPATNAASIHFEPEGLRFKKPAGLRLNATGCEVSSQPSILYLDDHGNVVEQIDAVYTNWWKTVAAPITHFSVYAIGV